MHEDNKANHMRIMQLKARIQLVKQQIKTYRALKWKTEEFIMDQELKGAKLILEIGARKISVATRRIRKKIMFKIKKAKARLAKRVAKILRRLQRKIERKCPLDLNVIEKRHCVKQFNLWKIIKLDQARQKYVRVRDQLLARLYIAEISQAVVRT